MVMLGWSMFLSGGLMSRATRQAPGSGLLPGIRKDGSLAPSSSVGNNKTGPEQADQVILEVNSWQPAALDGMDEVYYGTALPPHRKPILLERPDDRNSAFSPPDEASRRIADHLPDFLRTRAASP